MGDVNSVMRDLDMSAERVRELLELGTLVGFNISAKKSGCRVLRILTKSVERYRATGKIYQPQMEWPEIFRLILPHEKLFVRGHEIARGLNCDRGHVENLIESGLLTVNKKSQPGPNGSPIIPRNSFENFLIGRLQ